MKNASILNENYVKYNETVTNSLQKINKQLGIKRSITLLGKDGDQLTLRTPITNENVRIFGEPDEIAWLHLQMVREQMYRLK